MDEVEETQVTSVGERLRSAREDKKVSLEEIAAQTRIPRRHLESLEAGDWDKLPAPTYTIGFARSYASAVGLDRTEISDQLRGEMGGRSPTATTERVAGTDLEADIGCLPGPGRNRRRSSCPRGRAKSRNERDPMDRVAAVLR